MPSEHLGRDVRAFLLGLLADTSRAAGTTGAIFTPNAQATVAARLLAAGVGDPPLSPSAASSADAPDLTQITLLPNSAVQLPSGNLILGVQADNSAYRLDPQSGQIEILFQLTNTVAFLWRVVPTKSGLLYASLSGTRPPGGGNLQWGKRGIIFSIDLVREILAPVPGFERLIDPVDVIVLQDGSLLVVDFMGFNGAGAIYLLNPSTGDLKQLDLGRALHDPNCAYLDDDGVLFVANPWQFYQNRRDANGLPLKDYGNVVMIDPTTKAVETIYDNSANPQGAIVGVTGSSDKKYVVLVRTDWPVLSASAILRVDRATKAVTPLLEASASSRRFFSPRCAVVGDLLYVADSYQRELLAVEIATGKIAISYDMRPIIPGGIGMVSSTQSIESVVAIP